MIMLRELDEASIHHLYSTSLVRDFPASELKSLSAILSLYHRGEYRVLGAYNGETLIAYALLYCPEDERIALLDYLAVEPAHRGIGVGSAFLSQLRAYFSEMIDMLMIECERPKAAPDEAEARKRIRFYTRAGAVLTSVRIWLFGVEYSILVLPCSSPLPECDWSSKMLGLYRSMLPEALYRSNVRLIRN